MAQAHTSLRRGELAKGSCEVCKTTEAAGLALTGIMMITASLSMFAGFADNTMSGFIMVARICSQEQIHGQRLGANTDGTA